MSLLPATVSVQAQLSTQPPEDPIRAAAATSRQEGITRYVRFAYRGAIRYGILDGRQVVTSLEGDLYGEHTVGDLSLDISEVKLLAPVEPSNVIAVGLNYQSHLGERAPAEYPGLFAKFPTSIVGPDADIVRPPDSRNNVSVGEAADYIFGITAGNDISERDWQGADLQWLRAKGADTFGPVGPWVVTGLDYNDLHLESRVNGEVRQSGRTSDLIFDVETIVSYVSRYVTLSPGDIIFTGTPGSTRAMEPGDVVEIVLEGVGVLRNTVVQGR
jgi:2-keto-4-pentenoate hydratase/2-oxohepta-3-ene-1,7-dioic acid hydratase in catechol pathway